MDGSIGDLHLPLWCSISLLLLPGFALTACAPPPPLPGRTASAVLTDTDNTRLGRAVRAGDTGEGRSGLHVLPDPLEAFAARMRLVNAAERSLDVQYYIWRPDTTGSLLLDALWQAADRGVRVRLLLDDNGVDGMDTLLAAADLHDHIEVRLFNPYPNRSFKALGYLTNFSRLNRRMHNKALIADGQAAIVGGRNVGDAYFGADPALAFADLDVLTAGAVPAQAGEAFDSYWNSALARPLPSLFTVDPSTAGKTLAAHVQAIKASPEATRYLQALGSTGLVRQIDSGHLTLDWVSMLFLSDPPGKIDGSAPSATWLASSLAVTLGRARHSVDLISPYFVPGAGGTAELARQAGAGTRVRVVTNSLAATDVAAVHAGYSRWRGDLLRAGVQLFELRPDAQVSSATRWRLGSSGSASLHGKTFSLDGQRAFVGSMNLDPRSIRLNTELGVVVESPALASAITGTLDKMLPAHAYELRLGNGGRIEWIEHTASGELIHHDEPGATRWRRWFVSALSWLPIEWLL
ncbi:MAG: phospholipase D family protein [Burkholderiaceae bacterium]